MASFITLDWYEWTEPAWWKLILAGIPDQPIGKSFWFNTLRRSYISSLVKNKKKACLVDPVEEEEKEES